MTVTNKIEKFKPGPTISASHLNTVVNRLNRAPPIGVSGLSQTTLPGNQVAYGRPPQTEITFAELGQDMDKDDGGKFSYLLSHVVKGADTNEETQGFEVGGMDPSTTGTRFRDIHDGQESVYLTGERHPMLYISNAAGSVPIGGIQMMIGKATDFIPCHGTGTVNIRRELFDNQPSGTALDDGIISVEAADALGTGLESQDECLLFQALHDRKWYFMHSPMYAGVKRQLGGTGFDETDTSDTALGLSSSGINTSKAFEWLEVRDSTKALYFNHTDATNKFEYSTQSLIRSSVVNVSAHIVLIDTISSGGWSRWEFALQVTTNGGSVWADIPDMRTTIMVGTELEELAEQRFLTHHAGLVKFVPNRFGTASLHADTLLRMEHIKGGVRAVIKYIDGHADGSVVNVQGAFQVRMMYPMQGSTTSTV